MGLQARMLSQAMRKLVAVTSKSKTTLLFINQVRDKIGTLWGSPETTTGGRALKFYASVRLDIRRISTTTTDNVKTGNKTKVKVVKNKLAAPFKECEIEIIFGEGIDNYADILNYASEKEIIQKAGAWYSYKGTRIGQGADNAKEWLKSNPKISTEIESELRKIYFESDTDAKK
jgi:recombination protein RecA